MSINMKPVAVTSPLARLKRSTARETTLFSAVSTLVRPEPIRWPREAESKLIESISTFGRCAWLESNLTAQLYDSPIACTGLKACWRGISGRWEPKEVIHKKK